MWQGRRLEAKYSGIDLQEGARKGKGVGVDSELVPVQPRRRQLLHVVQYCNEQTRVPTGSVQATCSREKLPKILRTIEHLREAKKAYKDT